MPKNKKQNAPYHGGSGGGGSGSGAAAATVATAGGQHRNIQPFSDEDASIETMSHCSGYSDPSSFAEDGPEVLDAERTQDLEYKLKGLTDLTLDKSVKTWQAAPEGIKNALASKMFYEFILERRMTLTDSVEHCLKKGKSDEQRAAAALASILCIQLGPGIESEEILKTLGPILKKIICDGTASIQARQTCATCFGVCSFIATDDITELYSTLDCLENVFTKSYLKDKDGNGICSAPSTALHISSLLSWTLLLTICPISEVKRLEILLSCDDVNMRIAAGESLALLFELAREMESERDFPTETVKFGPEHVDSWIRDAVPLANELLRNVFELGPPVMLDAAMLKTMKISRFERHLYNCAAFKAGQKTDVGEFF
uniref:Interferon-related developmental regulator 1 n=1 Tax=Chinchilla lanigera TaxID=34839 RepID=A0A8C2VP48_CHILA